MSERIADRSNVLQIVPRVRSEEAKSMSDFDFGGKIT
jgi:hypothetical protein